MEHQSIGKFISILRKEKGLTQKELGNKLFVSDKTISRWECDDCMPEISLILKIAEIFEITADELLRGQKDDKNNEKELLNGGENKNLKSNNIEIILNTRQKKYNNQTLISSGIIIVGLLIAVIINLGFSKGLIAFCCESVFCIIGEICQICFTMNTRIYVNNKTKLENGDVYYKFNTEIINRVVIFSFINLSIMMFSFPLVTMINGVNYGLGFKSWIMYGSLYMIIGLVVSYIVYVFVIRKYLIKKKIIIYNKEKIFKLNRNTKTLGKILIATISVAMILSLGLLILNIIGIEGFTQELTFDSLEKFKAYMEEEYDEWYEQYNVVNGEEHIIVNSGSDKDNSLSLYPNKEWGKIVDKGGKVICQYYYNPQLYKEIIFTESSANKMPVTVLTNKSHFKAINWFNDIKYVLMSLIILDFVISFVIYLSLCIFRKNGENNKILQLQQQSDDIK